MTAPSLIEFNKVTFGSAAKTWTDENQTELFETEEKLLRELGAANSGPALCLGCGGGREAIALSRKGFQVTAVDQVPELIEFAKEQNEKLGLNIRFILSEITSFQPEQPFHTIFLLNRVYSYIPGSKQRSDFLRHLKESMDISGVCIVNFLSDRDSCTPTRKKNFWRIVSRLLLNFDHEAGDMLPRDDIYVHNFASIEEVSREAKNAGFSQLRFLKIAGDDFGVFRK